jgi:general secretion pathway protein I
LCRSTPPPDAVRDCAGFTLIEVVVTLAVIAAILTSIGSLVSVTVRGVHALDSRVALIEAARSIATGLPGRDSLTPGSLSGQTGGQSWRVDVRRFSGTLDAQTQTQTLWLPLTVSIAVQAPDGTSLKVTTLRLRRGTAG